MHETQARYVGESARAFTELVNNPEGVHAELIPFGPKEDRTAHTGLALYFTPDSQEFFNHDIVSTYAVDFLRSLSVESYYNRFISGQPSTDQELATIASHFIEFDERYHVTIAMLHENRMIAAASAFRPKFSDLREYPVAEVSVTIGDLYQRMGLGRTLLERITEVIKDQNLTHIMANFVATNKPSMDLLDTLYGSQNLVAGLKNFEMRAYRLGTTNPHNDIALEALLRKLAGPGNTRIYEPEETAEDVHANRLRNPFSVAFRQLLRQSESSGDEQKEKDDANESPTNNDTDTPV